MTLRSALAGLVIALVHVTVSAQETAVVPVAGLAQDDGWELVFAHCSACHSLRLVTSNRGDRATWLRLIRWMQATQNLWSIDPAVEARLLDYLERNYGPEESVRRAQLPAHLLPP
ncbi:MAG: hypothetical protein PVF63_05485 [Gammaproteobacteria bacterium]|jgi:hypothetical protein